jgi:hypothetical protein
MIYQKRTTLSLLLTLAISASVFAQATRQVARSWPNGGYLEYLPEGYDTASSQRYPTIIFLHGSGARGTGTPTELQKIIKSGEEGPPVEINKGHNMCFTVGGVTECYIVLSPQTNQWDFVGVGAPFARWAKEHYKIDTTRLYITGLSMGGRGSWAAAYEMTLGETLFSAIAPVAANGSSAYGIAAEAHNLRVWAIHGDQDTALPLEQGKIPIDAMVRLKANPAPIFTIEAGGTHWSTYKHAYNTTHTYYNPNIYEWFLSLNRLVVNAPPTVTGTDKLITSPASSVTLSATAADPDPGDSITSYYWYKKSGGNMTLANFKGFATPNLTLTNLIPGTHTFILLAVNDKGQHAYDDVTLVVNQVPTVSAGADQEIALPTTTTTLTATASDPNPGGRIQSYLWTKVSGPSVTMTNTTKATANLAQLVAGTYVFQIKVTDNNGAIATDEVQVNVTPAATTALTTQSDNAVYAYPNPVSSTATIQFTTPQSGELTFKLYNSWGRKIKEMKVAADHTSEITLELPVEHMTQGVYLLEVQSETTHRRIRILKE